MPFSTRFPFIPIDDCGSHGDPKKNLKLGRLFSPKSKAQWTVFFLFWPAISMRRRRIGSWIGLDSLNSSRTIGGKMELPQRGEREKAIPPLSAGVSDVFNGFSAFELKLISRRRLRINVSHLSTCASHDWYPIQWLDDGAVPRDFFPEIHRRAVRFQSFAFWCFPFDWFSRGRRSFPWTRSDFVTDSFRCLHFIGSRNHWRRFVWIGAPHQFWTIILQESTCCPPLLESASRLVFFLYFFLSDDVVEYGDFLVALGFHAGGSVRVINQPLRLSLAKKKPSVKPESVGGRHVPRSAAGARNANNTNKIKKWNATDE